MMRPAVRARRHVVARGAWRGAAAVAAPVAPLPAGSGTHPLADAAISQGLHRRADEIEAAFAAIEPALRAIGPRQFDAGFGAWANAELAQRLGFTLPATALDASLLAPLDMRRLGAQLALRTFARLVERAFDRGLAERSDGESAQTLIRRWGFHAIDITPCADGRLSGVVDYILRVPPAVVVSRRSYAGAMFDVEESLRAWESVELRRWRDGVPNAAAEPTRYLKIGVYHFSSGDPATEGCAAHGSDAQRAARALLERLDEFAAAVAATQCCDARAAILLVGVDTDSDAIRVHVPDAADRMSPDRFVDNAALYDRTRERTRDSAKDAIRDAVAVCAGVAADDAATEGMRWLCGYLLKNNIGQIDAVRARYGGSYPDRGHAEHLIVVGDAVDDVQVRNVAFQAQMTTVEEGAGDLDVGMRILGKRHAQRGLAVPVLVHCRFDPRIPGAEEHARMRARRLRAAIEARYARRADAPPFHAEAFVRAGDGSMLIPADPSLTSAAGGAA